MPRERRTVSFNLRLSPSEHKLLVTRARKRGRNAAQHLRELLHVEAMGKKL